MVKDRSRSSRNVATETSQRGGEHANLTEVPFTGRFVDTCKATLLCLEQFESADADTASELARTYLRTLPSKQQVSIQPNEVHINLAADSISALTTPKDGVNAAEKVSVQDFLRHLNRRFAARMSELAEPVDLSGIVIESLFGVDIGLQGANLENASLPDSTFYDANCSRAILRGACLFNGILRGNFDLADLRGADLRNTIFGLQGSALGADLRGADLRSASLYDLDLSGSKLSGVLLDMVKVSDDTNFSGAEGVQEINLGGRKIVGVGHRPVLEKNGRMQLVLKRDKGIACSYREIEVKRAIIVEDAIIDLQNPEVKGEMVLLVPEGENKSCFYVALDSVKTQLGV